MGTLKYTINMFPKSENAHKFPSSNPAILQRIPKAATNNAIQRTVLIQILSLRIRLAAISEKLIIPRRHVNANRQKQNVTRNVITAFIAVPGVSAAIDAVNFGSLSSSAQAAAPSPVQQ